MGCNCLEYKWLGEKKPSLYPPYSTEGLSKGWKLHYSPLLLIRKLFCQIPVQSKFSTLFTTTSRSRILYKIWYLVSLTMFHPILSTLKHISPLISILILMCNFLQTGCDSCCVSPSMNECCPKLWVSVTPSCSIFIFLSNSQHLHCQSF